ncbi:MAG: ATP-dependent RecD-like DNA helicase [Puniceicoccales bacterium]|jgi:exodeoxyribonuclease V alpha subunit|nr:ATP-dependent RecD-like DNA helicase [Puniceicoccales bacterium]
MARFFTPVPDSNELQKTIAGILERIIFRNDSNSYSVAEVKVGKCGDKATICGILPGVQCGETLEMTGTWTTHERHGLQFNVEKFESKLPSDVNGIRRYLGSGLIEGVGKIYAKKIVDLFGAETFSVLSNESSRLLEVEGIGIGRATKIKEAWDSQFAIRDIMVFLQTYGVTNALCMKLYEKYGADACNVLETDPYRVAQEVQGIGFKTADKIAKNIGIPTTHASRIDAGIMHILAESEDGGHTCMFRQQLVKYAQILLELPPDRIDDRVENLISFGRLCTLPDGVVQKSSMRKMEECIEKCLQNILFDKSSTLPDIWIEKAIDWAQKRESLAFAREQIEAIEAALANKISILTGGPGTGKTTILRALVSILSAKKVNIVLCAPTGRAAQKISETTGKPAQTIHRLLQHRPGERTFLHDEATPLKLDFIIVDETSMVDVFLAAALFRALPSTAHVLLVGDTDQLPSIGPGNVLGDIIKSERFQVTRLRRIFRQEARSTIVSVAHDIISSVETFPTALDSVAKVDPAGDFHFIESASPEDCLEKIATLCREYLPLWYNVDSVDDVQILVPMHRGTIGTENLNATFQDIFIGKEYGAAWTQFRIGDKVIQTKNNYEKNVFNGDLGRVIHLDSDNQTATVKFNGEIISLGKNGLGDMNLAYAISIHKSQGSEFPIVIVALLRQHYVMLQRNLLYTAITRGKNKVFIVGDPNAYSIAIQNKEREKRMTGLYSHIRK